MADVLVVGGGPAGLATAIQARLAGLTATVLDRGRPPIDKACGEGLMPDAVERLAALGVELPPGESSPIRGIRYLDGDLVAEGRFPGAGGLGVRRLALHRAMIERAEALGVELHWETVFDPQAAPPAALWIVGADGLRSKVRQWAGLEGGSSPLKRFGVRRHFHLRPWSDCVEVYWGPECEAYVTPVAADELGVALLWSGPAKGFDDILPRFPELAGRLAGAEPASRDRGIGPLHQRVQQVCRGNVALVGDAAGYLDAITGEGMAIAFHQAAALVAAIERGELSSYAAAHRKIHRLPDFITRLVLGLEKRPGLRRRALRALAADPDLFSRILGIHGRTLRPRELGVGGAFRLAWGLVAA